MINQKMNKKKFSCDKCDFKTIYKNCLVRHRLTKHLIGFNKFHICHLCGKKFIRKDVLTEHLLLFHNIGVKREFKCEICELIFKQNKLLKRHINSKHVKKSVENMVSNNIINGLKGPLMGLELICFDTKLNLKEGDLYKKIYRLDLCFLNKERKIVVHVEIDEKSHIQKKYCKDEERIIDIYNEYFMGYDYKCFRFNIDNPSSSLRKKDETIEKRIGILIELIKRKIKNHKDGKKKCMIYYLFYNRKSDNICKKLSKKFIG